MNREEIIKLALEAGDDFENTLREDQEFLIRFAAIVEERAAAQERKAWQDTVKKILVEVKKSDERYMNLFKINNELIELIQKAKKSIA